MARNGHVRRPLLSAPTTTPTSTKKCTMAFGTCLPTQPWLACTRHACTKSHVAPKHCRKPGYAYAIKTSTAPNGTLRRRHTCTCDDKRPSHPRVQTTTSFVYASIDKPLNKAWWHGTCHVHYSGAPYLMGPQEPAEQHKLYIQTSCEAFIQRLLLIVIGVAGHNTSKNEN